MLAPQQCAKTRQRPAVVMPSVDSTLVLVVAVSGTTSHEKARVMFGPNLATHSHCCSER